MELVLDAIPARVFRSMRQAYLPGLRTPTPYVEVKDANEKHWTAWRADHPRPVE